MASSSKNCCQYDVFINHRGPDVKKTFASHLYHSLTERGLKVFLDKEELQKGDSNWCQIKDAIRVASVHIAIFSPTYAHSNWCLDELRLMLKSRSTIIPVFFGVKPSKLRWTEGEDGEYAQALRTLQNKRKADFQPRYDSNTIQKWKQALYDVADLNGFELEAYKDDEGQLRADVVQLVLEKIAKRPLYVSKYPTGLDAKVRDFKVDCIRMQDHLRDLGRYLADKEPLRRIWSVTENLSDQSPMTDMSANTKPEMRSTSPCASCKFQRKKCSQSCVLAPYFPEKDLAEFLLVHKVFGIGQIIKLLQELPEEQRGDAVNSMVYEARARIRDPVHGSVGVIKDLQNKMQSQIAELQSQMANISMRYANLLTLLNGGFDGSLLQSEDIHVLDDVDPVALWEPLWK